MTHDFLDIDALAERSGLTRARVLNRLHYVRDKGRPVTMQRMAGMPDEYSWQDFKAAMPVNKRHSDATSRAMARVRR